MKQYTIIARGKEHIITEHPSYGVQSWWQCKITYRHAKDKCAMCGEIVGNQGYRPLTNGYNRRQRFCRNH